MISVARVSLENISCPMGEGAVCTRVHSSALLHNLCLHVDTIVSCVVTTADSWQTVTQALGAALSKEGLPIVVKYTGGVILYKPSASSGMKSKNTLLESGDKTTIITFNI